MGAAAASYGHNFFNQQREVWSPLALTPEQLAGTNIIFEWLQLVARLKPEVSLEQARQEMAAKAQILRERYPRQLPGDWSLPVTLLDERAKAGSRAPLLLLAGAVVFVLLITCANVANLMLARSLGRRKEIAIRAAIGAGRGHILGQLLVESLVLAGVGGILGLFAGYAGVQVLLAVDPSAATPPNPVATTKGTLQQSDIGASDEDVARTGHRVLDQSLRRREAVRDCLADDHDVVVLVDRNGPPHGAPRYLRLR